MEKDRLSTVEETSWMKALKFGEPPAKARQSRAKATMLQGVET